MREQRSTVVPDFESVAESCRKRRSNASSIKLSHPSHGNASAHVAKGENVLVHCDRGVFSYSSAGSLLHQHTVNDSEFSSQGSQSDDVDVPASEDGIFNTGAEGPRSV